MYIEGIDKLIKSEINRKYEGYEIELYASGFGGGVRDHSYDVRLKDGSRFVAVALYDTNTDTLTIDEREYIKH